MKIRKTNQDSYRDEVMTHLSYIKEKVDVAVNHLELMNGRLRTAENSLAAHKAVGITMVTVLTLAISIVGLLK